jgi:hypothetical protein
MIEETVPRDGGLTQEEIDARTPYQHYDTWIDWWLGLLDKP